jgi:hypothetical protein
MTGGAGTDGALPPPPPPLKIEREGFSLHGAGGIGRPPASAISGVKRLEMSDMKERNASRMRSR